MRTTWFNEYNDGSKEIKTRDQPSWMSFLPTYNVLAAYDNSDF